MARALAASVEMASSGQASPVIQSDPRAETRPRVAIGAHRARARASVGVHTSNPR